MFSIQEMNAMSFNQANQNNTSTIMSLPETLSGKIDPSTYAINFEMIGQNQMALASLSDFSVALIDVESLKPTVHIPEAHSKKIMGSFIGEENCFTCSNDGSVKMWDFKQKKPLIATLRSPSQNPLFSCSQAKHVLACGSNGIVYFYDIRNKKAFAEFGETHPDEVSSVEFFKGKASKLLTSSIDGMICQFDLKKTDEEEATETLIMLKQAINTCRFFENEERAAYALTTANTVAIISLDEARIVKEHNTILNYEINENSLIDAYTRTGEMNVYYLSANITGKIEEYALSASEENAALIRTYMTSHNGPINMIKKLSDEVVLSCGEDGTFQITKKYEKANDFDFAAARSEMFIEDEGQNEFLKDEEQVKNKEE